MSIEVILQQNYNHQKSLACNLFMAAAIDTWNRIQFTRSRPHLKIFETTITQNLVYELNLLKHRFGLGSFTIFESTNEQANGDDLEICIQHGRYVYCLAVQSKIIYHTLKLKGYTRLDDGVYKELHHSNKNGIQVDLLLSYARTHGCIPVYLLYSYVNKKTKTNETTCGVTHNLEQYGCAIISADYLKRTYNDGTGDLKPNVRFSNLQNPTTGRLIPWMVLACCDNSPSNLLNKLRISGFEYDISPLPLDAVLNDQRWQQIRPTTDNDSTPKSIFIERKTNKEFAPKYRILIQPMEQEQLNILK